MEAQFDPRPPVPVQVRVRVVVVGGGIDAEALQHASPDSWGVEARDWEADWAPDIGVDLVVLAPADTASVRQSRARWPRAAVLAVASEADDSARVVAVLESGADSCVRGGHPGMVAAYLVSLRRQITHGVPQDRHLASQEIPRQCPG